MKIRSNTFEMGDAIPERCAYGRKGASGETVRSENLNPHLAWSDAPEGTKAFVLACLDDDVPTSREPSALDAAGEIPASQARRRFVHWVQANVPADVTEVAEGELSGEKRACSGFGLAGWNDYTGGNPPAERTETGWGYDGPCPPFFDARIHFYRFIVLALSEALELPESFTWADVEKASQGRVLATAEIVGRYTLNPRL